MNTEQNGAAKIQEDTENLKSEFDKLLADVEDARQRLAARATALEELNKLHRLITDWIEEVEGKVRPEEVYRNDLSEKRALLEKYRTAQRNIQGHADTIDRLKSRLREDRSIPKGPYETSIGKYEELGRLVTEKINVSFLVFYSRLANLFAEVISLYFHIYWHRISRTKSGNTKSINKLITKLRIG